MRHGGVQRSVVRALQLPLTAPQHCPYRHVVTTLALALLRLALLRLTRCPHLAPRLRSAGSPDAIAIGVGIGVGVGIIRCLPNHLTRRAERGVLGGQRPHTRRQRRRRRRQRPLHVGQLRSPHLYGETAVE